MLLCVWFWAVEENACRHRWPLRRIIYFSSAAPAAFPLLFRLSNRDSTYGLKSPSEGQGYKREIPFNSASMDISAFEWFLRNHATGQRITFDGGNFGGEIDGWIGRACRVRAFPCGESKIGSRRRMITRVVRFKQYKRGLFTRDVIGEEWRGRIEELLRRKGGRLFVFVMRALIFFGICACAWLVLM